MQEEFSTRPASPLPQRRAGGMQPMPGRWTTGFRGPAMAPWQMDGSGGLYSFGGAPAARGKRRQAADMVSCLLSRGTVCASAKQQVALHYPASGPLVMSHNSNINTGAPLLWPCTVPCRGDAMTRHQARHCVRSSSCLQVQWEMAEAFELQYISAQAG